MKNQIHSLLVNIYGITVAVAVIAGAVVGVLFLLAFIINGQIAANISVFNLSIMEYSKKIACLAILVGLIDFYLLKEHHLTIDYDEDKLQEQ
ncbi:hypothetical protein [Desulfoscipio geothermicus]|uniref:Uncharacterized protein n=1 Tax=Desulfoscipio geothermicus DSM 3669 TaxID=1121426 RepID=A0A1I6EL10_9FIRM|nr:hypothetical protein [Desulfoscipio geothermicus]SFR18142.1 hypothetical protein SAMN05660706_1535 [Desulfoscipio geothermicus DSM 3669]